MTDIHKLTASKIFNKPLEEVTEYEREAAKKSIHYFNYGNPKVIHSEMKGAKR